MSLFYNHYWVSLMVSGLILLWIYTVFNNIVDAAYWRCAKHIGDWSRKRKRSPALASPRCPRRMGIIRHPDGQRETLAFFEKE